MLCTIVQGVLGVVVTNMNLLVGCAVLEPTWCALVAAPVMAMLSPVMVEIGAAGVSDKEEGEGDERVRDAHGRRAAGYRGGQSGRSPV